MESIFTLNDDDTNESKINLDELYNKKKQTILKMMNTYNKVLKRIHTKIKTTSRSRKNNEYCWYMVPDFILGVPNYDSSECVLYIINKLQENGFIVKYTHPNLLFICWQHWTPDYAREEFKKKTGISIDGYGNKKIDHKDKSDIDELNNKEISINFSNKKQHKNKDKSDSTFKDINSYKPSGNLIYNKDLFQKIQDNTDPN